MSFGFIVAASAGALFLPLAALFDPIVREVGFDTAASGLFAALDDEGDPTAGFAALGFVFWSILIAVCALPLAVAALIGEIAGARKWVWYVGVSGFLAAASPWIARATRGLAQAHRASPLELRIAALFFLTGAASLTCADGCATPRTAKLRWWRTAMPPILPRMPPSAEASLGAASGAGAPPGVVVAGGGVTGFAPTLSMRAPARFCSTS